MDDQEKYNTTNENQPPEGENASPNTSMNEAGTHAADPGQTANIPAPVPQAAPAPSQQVVYPHYQQPVNNLNQPTGPAGYSDYTYNPQPSQNQVPIPPKQHKRSKATKVMGLIAAFLAVGVLFSAITAGIFLAGPDKNNNQTVETTSAGETQSTEISPTTGDQASTAGNDNTDKHFSLEDAATRTDANKESLSVMEIAAQGKSAVVAISTEMTVTNMFGESGQAEAAGSGFIISADGYIVTNNHVIADAQAITVTLDNGDIYKANLVGTDPTNDVAVLKIDGTDLPTVTLGDSADLQVGELAVAIGNPLGELSGTVTVGVISALDRAITIDGQLFNLLQTDAAINAGNSGGALFNSFGEVIAINTAKNSGTGVEGLGFAIPINDAKPIIESLIQFGYIQGRPKIGVYTQDITEQMAQYYKLSKGVYIVEVEKGSAADQAGLVKGDIITAANGKEILTTEALNELKQSLKPGDTMALTIMRDGKEMSIDLILQEDVPTTVETTATGTTSGATLL